MSRTFLNQSTQIASSETYEDTLAIGSMLEYTRADEKTIHDDLNALRTMIRAALGTSNWYEAPASNIESLDMSKVSKAGDTMTGPLDMDSNYITGLPMPIQETDAASKVYVDTIAGSISVRAIRGFYTVTAPASAGSDLVYSTNLDSDLPDFDAGTFETNFDIFMNGQLLRPGTGGTGDDHDVYMGSTVNSLKLTYEVVVGDVICVVKYSAPGYTPPGGGGGGGPAGSGTYTVSYYGPSPLGGDMVLGLSDGTTDNIPLAYNMGVSTITVNGETLTINSDHAGSGLSGFPAGDNYFVGFSTEFIVAPSVGDTATFASAGGGAVSYTVSFYSGTHIGFSNGSADDVSLPGFNKDNSTMTINGETVTLGGMSSSNIDGVNHTTYLYTPAFSSAPSLGDSATYTP